MDEVLRLGAWIHPSTFVKHYNLPILGNKLTSGDLQSPPDLTSVITPDRYIPQMANKKQERMVRSIITQKRTCKQIQKANEILATRRVAATEAVAQEQLADNTILQQIQQAMPITGNLENKNLANTPENSDTISEQTIVEVEPIIQMPEIPTTHSPAASDAESIIEFELEPDSPPTIQGSLATNLDTFSDTQLNIMAFCSTKNDIDFMMNTANAKIKYGRVQTNNTITLGAHTATVLQYQDIADTEEFRSKEMENQRYCFIKALQQLKIPYRLFPGHKQGFNIPILNPNGELVAHKKQSQAFPQGYKRLPTSYTRTRSKPWTLSSKPDVEPKPGHQHAETNTLTVIPKPVPKKPRKGWDSYSKFLPPMATRPSFRLVYMWSSNKAHDFFLDSIRNLKTIMTITRTTSKTVLKKVHFIALDILQSMEDKSKDLNLQNDQKIDIKVTDGTGLNLEYAITHTV